MKIFLIILLVFLSSGSTIQSFSEDLTGNLIVTTIYSDGTAVIPEVCILFDSRWQEITRQFPSSNTCIFENLSNGVYQVEIYKNDFWIGDVSNINIASGNVEKTVVTKKYGALLFNVYYSDQHTKFPNVTVKLYSHANTTIDGGISDERGEVGFSELWPNHRKGEYYWAKAEVNGIPLKTIKPIDVDEQVANHYSFTLEIERPPKGMFALEPAEERIIVEFVVVPLVFSIAVAVIIEIIKKPIRKAWKKSIEKKVEKGKP